jgi:ankyrin repeat protein
LINVNQTVDGYTPFYTACEQGHTDIIDVLLKDQRVNFIQKSKGTAPIQIARTRGHDKIVALLQTHLVSRAVHAYKDK